MQPIAVKPITIGSILVIISIIIALLVGIGVLPLTPVWFAVCIILIGLGLFI